MGLGNSKHEMNPQDHPAIWISEPSLCSDCNSTRFPTEIEGPHVKPSVLLKDSALWEEFSNKMNAQATQLNKYLGPLYIFYTIIVALCVFLKGTRLVSFIHWAIIPAAILTIGGHVAVVNKNKGIDLEIAKIVKSYQDRFAEQGIQLEYVTKWTHFCKPRHVRAMRVLLFKPAVNELA